MRILLCTDGSPVAEAALAVGLSLTQSARASATLLGVVTATDQAPFVEASLGRARQVLDLESKVREGRPAPVILDEAEGYDLIVMGSRGHRGWRRLAFGSVAARLARYSPIPVLIIKGGRALPFRRLLACTSGDVRGERAARWGGQLAHWFQAESTVLHVMSQIPMSSPAALAELAASAATAMAQPTREGQHLTRAVALMSTQGAPPPITPKLRYGLVRDEIVAEVTEGDYDLIVLGGHQAPDFGGQINVIRDYLLEDIADQILMAVERPILIVKGP